MASRVGTLFVDLVANTKQFIDELDKSRTKSTIFGVAVGKIFADIAQGAARMARDVAVAIPRMVEQQIDFAETLNKSSQRTGIAVEQLSALSHAAEISDVAFGSLETGLQRFNRNIFEAGKGSKEQATAFNEIGVAVKSAEGKFRPTIDVLEDVSEIFSQMPDGVEKTARAIELFGRSGADLIPLLNAGKAGLAGFTEEAERLGLVIGSETAQRAEEFNDNLKRLKDIGVGLANSIASVLLPALEGTSRLLLDARDSADAFFERVGIGAPNLKTFAGFLRTLNIEQLESLRIRGLSLIGEAAAAGDKERLEQLKKNQEEIDKSLQRLAGTTDTARKAFAEAGKAFSQGFDLSGFREELKSLEGISLPKVSDVRLLTPEQKKKLEDDRKAAEKAIQDFAATFQKSIAPASALNSQILQLIGSGKSLSDIQKVYNDEIGESVGKQTAFGKEIPPLIASLNSLREITEAQVKWSEQFIETGARQAIQTSELGSEYNALRAKADALRLSMESLNEEIEHIASVRRDLKPFITDEQLEQLAQLPDDLGKLPEVFGNVEVASDELGRSVSTTFTNMAQGIAGVAVEGGSLSDVFDNVSKRIQAAILSTIIEGALEPLIRKLREVSSIQASGGGILGQLLSLGANALGGLFGGSTSASIPSVLGGGLNIKTPLIGQTLERGGPVVPHFAAGGEVPAILHSGEFVMNRAATQRVGTGVLDTLNKGGSFGSHHQTIIQYNVDARGASPGVGQEVLQALKGVEDRAVSRSVRTIQELRLRTA